MKYPLPMSMDPRAFFASIAASLTYKATSFSVFLIDAKERPLEFEPEHPYVKKMRKYVDERNKVRVAQVVNHQEDA